MNTLLFIAGIGCLCCLCGVKLIHERKAYGSFRLLHAHILTQDEYVMVYWLWLTLFAIPFILLYGVMLRCTKRKKT